MPETQPPQPQGTPGTDDQDIVATHDAEFNRDRERMIAQHHRELEAVRAEATARVAAIEERLRLAEASTNEAAARKARLDLASEQARNHNNERHLLEQQTRTDAALHARNLRESGAQHQTQRENLTADHERQLRDAAHQDRREGERRRGQFQEEQDARDRAAARDRLNDAARGGRVRVGRTEDGFYDAEQTGFESSPAHEAIRVRAYEAGLHHDQHVHDTDAATTARLSADQRARHEEGHKTWRSMFPWIAAGIAALGIGVLAENGSHESTTRGYANQTTAGSTMLNERGPGESQKIERAQMPHYGVQDGRLVIGTEGITVPAGHTLGVRVVRMVREEPGMSPNVDMEQKYAALLNYEDQHRGADYTILEGNDAVHPMNFEHVRVDRGHAITRGMRTSVPLASGDLEDGSLLAVSLVELDQSGSIVRETKHEVRSGAELGSQFIGDNHNEWRWE